MNAADDVGPRESQDVVVALEVASVTAKAIAAVAPLIQPVLLHHRAHRAIEQHDALIEQPLQALDAFPSLCLIHWRNREWRGGGAWLSGLIVAHNDVTTHNAAWHRGTLTGFFDWDFAGPATAEWDVALAGFAWVPLHLQSVVAAEGFTDFAARPRRLDLFLASYGWSGTTADFLAVVEARMNAHAAAIRARAAAGEEAFERLLVQGVPDAVDQALADLASFPR